MGFWFSFLFPAMEEPNDFPNQLCHIWKSPRCYPSLFTEKDERWAWSPRVQAARSACRVRCLQAAWRRQPRALSLGAWAQSPVRPLREGQRQAGFRRVPAQPAAGRAMVKRARMLQARPECTQPAPACPRHSTRTQEVLLMWPLVLGATYIVTSYNPQNDCNSPCLYPKFVEEGSETQRLRNH